MSERSTSELHPAPNNNNNNDNDDDDDDDDDDILLHRCSLVIDTKSAECVKCSA